MHSTTHSCWNHMLRKLPRLVVPCVVLVLAAQVLAQGPARKFYDDDPIAREPETRDASKVKKWDIGLMYDLGLNTFAHPGDLRKIKALNVNTIDEVPDSNWFTNRIGARPYSIAEAIKGPLTDEDHGMAPGPLTILKEMKTGVSPKFLLKDSAGVTWFVQLDAKGYPEASTGASMVANKLFHALGYWQVKYQLGVLRADDLRIGEKATAETPSGEKRRFQQRDIVKVLRRANQGAEGTYRVMASRGIDGVLGGFKYNGTRPDDPNDVVPHEHRRELRALKVFAAWANLVDLKAGNTLDATVEENGRTVVRHYLQDVGSTFGTGALGPREFDEGYENQLEPDKVWKRLVSFGFYFQPWQFIPYTYYPAIGYFEGERFDPPAWKPRVPSAAILNARADDLFWAAQRVVAFSDDMLRAIVHEAHYSDPAAERHLATVLMQRRDKIAAAYLPAINPVVRPALDAAGRLTFGNAAVDARVAREPSGGYNAAWFVFDNTTGSRTAIGGPGPAQPGGTPAPGGLPEKIGTFVLVTISASDPAHPSWSEPVQAYFKRIADGWKLIGFERLQDKEIPRPTT